MSASDWISRFQSLVASTMQMKTTLIQAAEQLPGFQFDETMTGLAYFTGGDLPGGEHRVRLQLRATAPSLGDYLRGGRTTLKGTASIDGVTEDAPLDGSLWIWPHRRVIRYELGFPVGGHRVQIVGQKDVRLLDFSHTMTTLPAKLFDEHGAELGHCTVVFDWADLPSFLGSFRPLHGRAEPSPASA